MKVRNLCRELARLVAGLFLCGAAFGQVCYEYQAEGDSGWYADPESACSAGVPEDQVINGPFGCTARYTFTYSGFEQSDAGPPISGTCKYERRYDPGTCGGSQSPVIVEAVLKSRVAQNCAGPQCEDSTSEYRKTFGSGWPGPASYCETSTHCRVDRVFGAGTEGGAGWSFYQSSGETCSGSEDPAPDDGPECSVVNGQTLCAPAGEGDCGSVNGERVCVPDHPDSPPPDGCKKLSGGGMNCGEDAPTPPAPDNGTPGVPADPDLTLDVRAPSGDTINYYFNWNTVNGSTNLEPGQGGEPGCDPAVDEGCMDVGDSWVDREGWVPPGVPEFSTEGLEGLDAVPGKWSDTQEDVEGHIDTFLSFLRSTFPFSLFASPLAAFGGTSPPPQVEISLGPTTAAAPMDAFDSLFELVRIVEGLLLLFGFYLALVGTVRSWSK